MKAKLAKQHYPYFVNINKDRALRLVKLASSLIVSDGIISEHKLSLVIKYSVMVQRDINNQVQKGEYSNGLQEKRQEEVAEST
jgi:hypothetical protein